MQQDEPGHRGPPDNPEAVPGRLLGVAQREVWEREVRRTLADRAERVDRARQAQPARTDLAAAAIAQARVVQRRRRGLGMGVATVAVLAASAGLINGVPGGSLAEAPQPALFADTGAETDSAEAVDSDRASRSPDLTRLASDPAVTEQVATDVIGQGQAGGLVLAAADGRATHLGPISAVNSAHRVGDGWLLVGGAPGTVRLWWVNGEASAPAVLLSATDAVVVARDRVAWRRGSVLSTAVLSGGGELVRQVDTEAPAGEGVPVGFLGEAVLLARTEAGGTASWDVWLPTRGDYRPDWTASVIRVYGADSSGRSAVGLALQQSGEAHPCLVRLTVETLEVISRACLPDLPELTEATVSPDGRWLVGTAAPPAGAATRPVLVAVDLSAAFAGAPAVATVADESLESLEPLDSIDDAVADAGLAAAGARPVWLVPDQALLPTASGLVRMRPDRLLAGEPDAVEVITLSGDPPVLVEGGAG